MAFLGQTVAIEELLFNSPHGIVDQSLHSRMGAETTNGDGFGVGWYGTGDGPGVFHSVAPAWGDANLRHLAAHIESPLFIAHVRATSGGAIQETNCHPFRHGKWLFVHNGLIERFDLLRRDLMMEIDPALFPNIEGSTDSEVLFHLALTYGLEGDPIAALERTLGLVESLAERQGVADVLQASIGVTDGESLWAVRYSTCGRSRTLFHSAAAATVHEVGADNPRLQRVKEGDTLVVSEPFSDLPGLWVEIPESTALIVAPDGGVDQKPFRPRAENPTMEVPVP